MIAKTFLFVEKTAFSDCVSNWCAELGFGFEFIDAKNQYIENVDGLIMFHNNHDFTKVAEDLKAHFDQNNIPVHKVDINGTIVATSSNFILWLERNQVNRVIITGDANLSTNPNLVRFFESLARAAK